MRAFVTGATGYIGFAVARRLVAEGHEVHGLARSDGAARRLAAAGVAPVRGALQETDSYRAAAGAAQLVVHAGRDYEADQYAVDRQVVEFLLATVGPGATIIYTSGVWVYGDTGGEPVGEDVPLRPPAVSRPRPAIERLVLDDGRVRGLVARPAYVFGGPGGLTAPWFAEPAGGRPAAVVGDGTNRWPMVHVDDLARGYALLAARGRGGTAFNFADGSRDAVGDMARAAARAAGFGGGIRLVPVAEAAATMGPVAECLAMSQALSAARAASDLGWTAREPSFLDGVERYLAEWRTSG